MPKVYKIHPAIGVARVGNSDDHYLGPETPTGDAFELSDDQDRESAVTKYKDDRYRIKRQAVRFRVYEYEVDAGGREVSWREITADQAEIRWTAEVANTKPAYGRRNPQEPNRDRLRNRPGPRSISGRNQSGVHFDTGSFFGKRVPLGSLRTDFAGRLIFVPGHADSDSVPTGKPLPTLFDNDFWYDATSDGPVTATVQFANQPLIRIAPENSAWILTGPPDYEPAIDPKFALYDHAEAVAARKGWITLPARPSFTRDIFPKILRYARLKWSLTNWPVVSTDGAYLCDAPETERRRIAGLICGTSFVEEIPADERYELAMAEEISPVAPTTCIYMARYASGEYVRDWDGAECAVTPDSLDRANLERAQGQPFGRGIEGWGITADEESYIAAFRISPVTRKAGDLTDYLATPWQTDFYACSGPYWWPAQRPNEIYLESGGPQVSWVSPINDYSGMVKNYWRLGYVTGVDVGTTRERFFETGRDPSFPRRGLAEHPEPKRPEAP